MKQTAFLNKTGIVAGFVVAVGALTVNAQNLYSNTNTEAGVFSSPNNEIGSEIILADNGNGSTITGLSFNYYNTMPDNAASLTVYLYANDGPASSTGPKTPGTVLWSTSWPILNAPTNVPIGGDLHVDGLTFTETQQSDNNGDLPNGGVAVPSDFTWAVEFSGVSSGQDAGLVFTTDAPAVGRGYNDFWMNLGTAASPNWVLATNNVAPNLSFFFTASGTVPEPSSMALLGLGVVGMFGMLKRKASRS